MAAESGFSICGTWSVAGGKLLTGFTEDFTEGKNSTCDCGVCSGLGLIPDGWHAGPWARRTAVSGGSLLGIKVKEAAAVLNLQGRAMKGCRCSGDADPCTFGVARTPGPVSLNDKRPGFLSQQATLVSAVCILRGKAVGARGQPETVLHTVQLRPHHLYLHKPAQRVVGRILPACGDRLLTPWLIHDWELPSFCCLARPRSRQGFLRASVLCER